MNNPFRISEEELLFDRGEISFLHNNREILSSAFEISEKASIIMKIPRAISAISVKLEFLNGELLSIDFDWRELKVGYDLYQVKLPLQKLKKGIYYLNLIYVKHIGALVYKAKEIEY